MRRGVTAQCGKTSLSSRNVTPKLFGLEMVDLLTEGWERSAHLAIGEIRDDGSIDLMLLLESGTLRYIATLGAQDPTGIVPAPEPFRHLAGFTHQVLAANQPIVRRPSTVDRGFLLTIFPINGLHKRVVYVLEPEVPTPTDVPR